MVGNDSDQVIADGASANTATMIDGAIPRAVAVGLLGALAGFAGMLFGPALGLAIFGPSLFLGLALAWYIWTKDGTTIEALAAVIGTSLAAYLIAYVSQSLLDVIFSIVFSGPSSAGEHWLARAGAGFLRAAALAFVVLRSVRTLSGGSLAGLAFCAIAGAVLGVVFGHLAHGPLQLWRPAAAAATAAAAWQAGVSFVLALAIERDAAAQAQADAAPAAATP